MHSTFHLPMKDVTSDSRASVDASSAEAALIRAAPVIFIDEISMANRLDIGMVDHVCRVGVSNLNLIEIIIET
jgi:hypothetical protein